MPRSPALRGFFCARWDRVSRVRERTPARETSPLRQSASPSTSTHTLRVTLTTAMLVSLLTFSTRADTRSHIGSGRARASFVQFVYVFTLLLKMKYK